MEIEYKKMYEAVADLQGRFVKVFYIDTQNNLRIIIAELLKYQEVPANGSVMFDATLNELVSTGGFRETKRDPNQTWAYKIEFGTSVYNNLMYKKDLKKQICNSLWVTYTNPFGLRSPQTSLKILKLEFVD